MFLADVIDSFDKCDRSRENTRSSTSTVQPTWITDSPTATDRDSTSGTGTVGGREFDHCTAGRAWASMPSSLPRERDDGSRGTELVKTPERAGSGGALAPSTRVNNSLYQLDM